MTNIDPPGRATPVASVGKKDRSHAVIKRSVRIAGHPTSVSLEDAFWDALRTIAAERRLSLNALIAEVDAARESGAAGNLSSAIRVHILQWYRKRAAAPGPAVVTAKSSSSKDFSPQPGSSQPGSSKPGSSQAGSPQASASSFPRDVS